AGADHRRHPGADLQRARGASVQRRLIRLAGRARPGGAGAAAPGPARDHDLPRRAVGRRPAAAACGPIWAATPGRVSRLTQWSCSTRRAPDPVFYGPTSATSKVAKVPAASWRPVTRDRSVFENVPRVTLVLHRGDLAGLGS